MIKNDKQYKITKHRIDEFSKMLKRLQSSTEEADPIFQKIQLDAVGSQIIQFEAEIKEYECLRSGVIKKVVAKSLPDFCQSLTKARIIKKWSQADLAKKLKMKEQQIQRYESTNYSGASVERIAEVFAALDLEIQPFTIKVASPIFNIPQGLDRINLSAKLKKVREKRSLFSITT
jgi:transcriptional regulator with XRE-family HTH domain